MLVWGKKKQQVCKNIISSNVNRYKNHQKCVWLPDKWAQIDKKTRIIFIFTANDSISFCNVRCQDVFLFSTKLARCLNKNFKKQLDNWIKACAVFCSWENIVSVMFSVIIFYFTMYQNFNAHELTTIKSCCSFQYEDFSLLTDHSSVPENTNRERNRPKYENAFFAIVNNMIMKLRGGRGATALWIWFTEKIKIIVFQILWFMLIWSISEIEVQVPISSFFSAIF